MILRKLLKPYMAEDQYGLHTICNLYFDTKNYDLIRRSIEKPKYKALAMTLPCEVRTVP